MKTMIKSILLFCLAWLAIAGCKKDDYRGPELDLNANARITGFTVGSIAGTINDSSATVNITFPFGYDRTAVTPDIQIPAGATVSPASGTQVNLKNSIKYKVSNGNIYNTYTVVPSEEKAILSFVVAGVTATIDENARTITAVVPVTTNLESLAPQITLASGATISPASGTTVDFTNPVVYTVKKDTATVNYTVTVTIPETVAFLGTAATANDLTNADEKAAWTWLSSVNSLAEYVSFNSIKNGTVDLSKYKIIWWHEDETQDLPTIANDATVKAALKAYYAAGGNFLLTSFAAQYVDPLGIVPAGKGPNNSWSNSPVWVEATWPWGISFTGHSDHPAFAGLTLTSDKDFPTAYMLSNGCFRHNNTSQWHIGTDWGGFNTTADWRSQTGGIDLGGTEGDEYRSNQVTMAEFPKTDAHGAAIVIGAGCYDWYSEADPTNSANQPANAYLPNIQKMTTNILGYLSKQ